MLHVASVQGIRCLLTDIMVETEAKNNTTKTQQKLWFNGNKTPCSPDNDNAFQIDKDCKFHSVYMS